LITIDEEDEIFGLFIGKDEEVDEVWVEIKSEFLFVNTRRELYIFAVLKKTKL
jgi:hypothetical protein